MFPLFPKCRQPLDAAAAPAACPQCGLVFAKYLAVQRGKPTHATIAAQSPEDEGPWWERLLEVPVHCERWQVYIRAGAYVFLLLWGWRRPRS